MRIFAGAFLACTMAAAQVPGFGTSFSVRVVDEAGAAVPNTFVIGREFVDIPQFHGSQGYCDRSDVALAARAPHEVRLPAAGLGHLAPNRSHALEALAYAPGYCVEHTPSAQAAAHAANIPPGMRSETKPAVRASEEVTLRARPVQANEERLQYLLGLTQTIACRSWSDRSRSGIAALAKVVEAEADAIARSTYGKSLARRMHDHLATAMRLEPASNAGVIATVRMAPPAAREFIIGPANMAVRFPSAGDPNGMVIAAARPTRSAGGPLAIHCRHGAPSDCNLDDRDEQGQTALYQYAGKLDLEAVKLLLDAGANPSVTVNSGGADAIDALITRIVRQPPALGSNDAARAVQLMELIAANPKASIRADLAAQLASDPAQWFVKTPESVALLIQARQKLGGLPRRPDPALTCEPIQAATDYSSANVRLR